nr:MAG TPA: hypothetical protein [Caudoviricetes sp.]
MLKILLLNKIILGVYFLEKLSIIINVDGTEPSLNKLKAGTPGGKGKGVRG